MNNYNLLDYEWDNKFDFDFDINDKKDENTPKKNYVESIISDNIFEYNTLKPHHSSFKCGITL